MFSCRLASTLSLALSIGCAPPPGPKLPQWDDATWAGIAEDVQAHLGESAGATLSIAVQRGDSLLVARVYGGSGSSSARADTSTRFEIGEIERQFTSVLALTLSESGVVDLDAPLRAESVGAPADALAPTIRELLRQVSGLVAADSGGGVRLAGRPNTRWTESRVHYDHARRVLANRTGTPYEEMLADLARRAGLVSFDPRSADSVWSTPSDLVRWSRAIDRGGVLHQKAHQQLTLMKPMRDERTWAYGLGLELQTFEDRAKFMHAGTSARSTAVLARYPADDLSIAVMIDRPDDWRLPALERRIARRLFGLPLRLPAEQPLEPSDIERVAGEYECGALLVDVQPQGEALQLVVSTRERGASPVVLARHSLRHLGTARFVSGEDPDAVHLWFRRGAGQVPEIVVGWFGLPIQAVRRANLHGSN